MNTILYTPLITEKAMKATKSNFYSFVVNPSSSKHQIKEAVEKVFKVNVLSISTLTTKGKTKRVGKRRDIISYLPVKKAVIKIKKGQTIDIVPREPEEIPHETTKR